MSRSRPATPAKAELLQVVPIPWPGLIGNEGVLRSAGPIDR